MAADNMYTNVEDNPEASTARCNGLAERKADNNKALAACADEEYEEMMVQKEKKDTNRKQKIENKGVKEEVNNEKDESTENRLYAKVNKPRREKSANPSHKKLGVKVFDVQNEKNNLREIIHKYNQNEAREINYTNVVHDNKIGKQYGDNKQKARLDEKSKAMRATDDDVLMYENRAIYASQDQSK